MGVPAAAHRVAGCRLQVGSGVGRHDGGVVVAPSSRVAEVRRGGWSRVWMELGLRRGGGIGWRRLRLEMRAGARLGVGLVNA